jgi:hypothetical protein
MLFLLFGSSAAGKTVALDAIHGRVESLAIHDFDEVGVPAGADTAWRHRADEEWVRRALDYQAEGIDLLLAGQTPLGEMLAAPSAARLEAISACLLDCDDATRVSRLHARDASWLARTGGELQDFLNWAAWMREHVINPSCRMDVIWHPATATFMRWSRLSGWREGDARWRIQVIDTSARPVESVAEALIKWIDDERALFLGWSHPLTGARFADDGCD